MTHEFKDRTTIEYTNFVKRQFKNSFVGTKISEEISEELISHLNLNKFDLVDTYQTFCKYLIIENDYDEIKCAVVERSIEHQPFLRTGYSARTPEELPVLSEWLELPGFYIKPKANYLVFVLYSYSQLINEFVANPSTEQFELSEECEWGVVAILGCTEAKADPMKPITIMRNALGQSEGGNGAELDKKLYTESVEFWEKYIMIK